MANPSGIYVARLDAVSVAAARTLVQLNAPATRVLEVIRAWVQFDTTTSGSQDIRLKRVTTAGTGTAFAPILLRPADAAAATTVTTNHTAEGTLGAELWREEVNVLNGFLWLPVPEERIIVGPSGRLALDLPVAPAAAVVVTAGIVWAEIG